MLLPGLEGSDWQERSAGMRIGMQDAGQRAIRSRQTGCSRVKAPAAVHRRLLAWSIARLVDAGVWVVGFLAQKAVWGVSGIEQVESLWM